MPSGCALRLEKADVVVKGMQTMNASTSIPQPVVIALNELVDSLTTHEAFVAYRRAKAILEENEATQMLLKQYAEAQAEYRQQQSSGSLTQAHIDRVRQLQKQVQADPCITAFVAAQFPVRDLLNALASDLSSSLGFEFASFANVSSC